MPVSPLYVDLFYLDSINENDSTVVETEKLKKRVGPNGEIQYVLTTKYRQSSQTSKGRKVRSFAAATGNPG